MAQEARGVNALPRGRVRRASSVAGCLVAAALALAGCTPATTLSATDDRLQVVTTTGLLRDLVQNVGGERVNVSSIVPDGADPHSFEPTLRSVRDVVYADVAFSNYALLEEHSIIKTLDANLDSDAPNISLAEGAVKYAAELIPLVENVNLDTVWLGLRAHGDGRAHGATRTSEVLISAVAATGPGDVFGYLTGTFGDTERYFDSTDGFDAATGYRDDTATLPVGAHSHMSWAFTKPGVYTLTLRSRLQVDGQSRPIDLGEATYTFAVGVKPGEAGIRNAIVLDAGHADLTADLDEGTMGVVYDREGGGEGTQQRLAADDVVIDVPNTAIDEVPPGAQYGFLGRAGDQLHQLPQAVLGKHVHGEIDPHLWQDVGNAMAYVKLIRDTLIEADPDGAREYRDNADVYLGELESTDAYVRETIARIPAADRYLVTTHDAFAYLAEAYDVRIAGFVTPNPAVEPSLSDRRKLAETIRNLDVPAVFLEPNLAARSSTLTELARDHDLAVCPIYGDTFDDTVTTYVQLIRANADSLRSCLTDDQRTPR